MTSESVENRLGKRLSAATVTLATAESCTGGLIAHRVTNTPGSSAYFLGGVTAYADAAKVAILGVDADSITRDGAVSETVARQLAEGAQDRFGADYGIGTTGIAGPGGGSAEKPVGLVYIAVAGPAGTQVQQMLFEGDRDQIKAMTAEAALHLLEAALN